MGGSTDEFPLLRAVGLYVADTAGNGNCLFNALSDQLYGDQSSHHKIRSRVIDYMREHASYYKQFIDVHPGGGVRRNPKRKNAGAYSTSTNYTPPTAEEIERVFESHLQQMARGGTYGDNMEISAFSAAYKVDVKIYQRDFAYMISTSDDSIERQITHIAYHTWEHYSSIRNAKGPHTGLPNVEESYVSPEAEKELKEKLAKTPYVHPWMVNVVMQSLPYLADRATIQRTLEECRGSVDNAVSKLLDAEERGSVSSAQESSSVEREPDSGEEAIAGPNKKQDRRLSRVTRTVPKENDERPKNNLAVRLKSRDPRLQSNRRHNVTNGSSPLHEKDHINVVSKDVNKEDFDETEEEDWQNDSTYKDSDSPSSTPSASASDYSTASKPRSGGVRLKLSQPKRENAAAPPPPSNIPTELSNILENSNVGVNGKTQQRQPGPKQKRVTMRDKRDMKKAAQKAAAKERKQGIAAGRDVNGQMMALALAKKKGKENSPAIEAGIKTLYI